ncbi:flagellar hook-basal body complex protein FliE [Ferruginivarius sediminum]|uniref:Flagellar hook-basal body complex protein FliE n=1 Tax=Ferruginivarius sediminum TaxID=2661937 RepID=A0A369T689_9PROT|nr:flagellar hook-basal body complex protein FliE [Ferruginivarius sediminum]RDD60843.1 flagellar hook-basal body complex protein FliE [Ferruginivarius sediminum]
MTVSYSEALAAYNRVAQQARPADSQSSGESEATGGQDFAKVLRESAGDAIGTLRTAETQSLAAAAGKADINDVVMAMSQAEMTLQTVVTLRDRAVQAYQDILRMPI